jgi:hypothetical protein
MKYNTTYLSQLNKTDFEKILSECGYKIIDNFINMNGQEILGVQKYKNMVICRCTNENMQSKNQLSCGLEKFKPAAQYMTFSGDAENLPDNADVVIFKEYCAYSIFDENIDKYRKITLAYNQYCAKKFGKQYLADYKNHVEDLFEDEETL